MSSIARQEKVSIKQDALAAALVPLAAALIRAEESAEVLVRAAKFAYLQAAISQIRSRNDRPSVSRLSVITGMTRKEVSALLKTNLPRSQSLRKRLDQRAQRVLRGWRHDPLYTLAGRPRELKLKGESRTFASLVRAYAGDVPPVSVLRELERMKAVCRTQTGTVRLRSRVPMTARFSAERFDEFAGALADFSHAVSQSVLERSPQDYFGFKEIPALEDGQIARFKESFSRRAATLLEGVELWAESRAQARRRGRSHFSDARRVGVGVYLMDVTRAPKPMVTRR